MEKPEILASTKSLFSDLCSPSIKTREDSLSCHMISRRQESSSQTSTMHWLEES